MRAHFLIGLGLAVAASVVLTPVPAGASPLFPVMAFSFAPDYFSAEWAPWDASFGAVPWYRTWYGMYRWSLWEDTERAQAWVNRHGGHGSLAAAKLTPTGHPSRPDLASGPEGSVRSHPSRMRTWDDIIAERKARGLTGPPVSTGEEGPDTVYTRGPGRLPSIPLKSGTGQTFPSAKPK